MACYGSAAPKSFNRAPGRNRHGQGSDAQQQGKEETEGRQEPEEGRRRALAIHVDAQIRMRSGKTGQPLLQPDTSNPSKPGALTPPQSLSPQSVNQQLQQMYQQRAQMIQQGQTTGSTPVR